MGCDIHMFVEYKRKDQTVSSWRSFGSEIHGHRAYGIFNRLAGVRGDGPAPKGRVKDMGCEAACADRCYISDTPLEHEYSVTTDRAARWVEEGCSDYTDERRFFVTSPDHHSHSWATKEELAAALHERDVYEDYEAIISCMARFEELGYDARVVYWFDN